MSEITKPFLVLNHPWWYNPKLHHHYRTLVIKDLLKYQYMDKKEVAYIEGECFMKSTSYDDYINNIFIEEQELQLRKKLFDDPASILSLRAKCIEMLGKIVQNKVVSEKLEQFIYGKNNRISEYLIVMKKIHEKKPNPYISF